MISYRYKSLLFCAFLIGLILFGCNNTQGEVKQLFVLGRLDGADQGYENENLNSILRELVAPIAACVQRTDTSHPAFHGCIDWHSAVHATWALIRYRTVTGDTQYDELIHSILSPEKLALEFQQLSQAPGFEMPYGRAWFLRLAIDYERAFNKKDLANFADYIAQSLVDYYSTKQIDPLAKSYANPSWALINLYQYSEHRNQTSWKTFVADIVQKHFLLGQQICKPEPGDQASLGFMDVCGNWAYLVALAGGKADYRPWVEQFYRASGVPQPIEETKDLHEKGLNFSRAWSYWFIFEKSKNPIFYESYLRHINTQLNHDSWWKGEDYSLTHWVAQFGVYALTPTYNK